MNTRKQSKNTSQSSQNPPPSNPVAADEILQQGIKDATEVIKQAAAHEELIVKSQLSTASRMAFQAFKILLAKKLAGAGSDDSTSLKAFYELTETYGFKKRTIQRRVQMATALRDDGVIGTELQLKIEIAESLDTDLLAEIEAKVGSTSGTKLMRELGILEGSETSIEKEELPLDKQVSGFLGRMNSTSAQMEEWLKILPLVRTSPEALKLVKEKGDVWISEMDKLRGKLQTGIDEIQKIMIIEGAGPASKEEVERRKAAIETQMQVEEPALT